MSFLAHPRREARQKPGRKGILLERARPYQGKHVAFYGMRPPSLTTLAWTQRVQPMCMAVCMHEVTCRETKSNYDALSNVQ
jgi:hypothetical protein